MVSSVLSPQKIIGQQKRNPEAFQKFFTGETAPLGSSVVGSAANKIVGFSREPVSPVRPDINNLVSSISNNIVNNVDNSIKNTTNFILSDVDKKINSLRDELYKNISNTQSTIDNLKKDLSKTISSLQDNVSKTPVQSVTPVTQIQQVVQNIQAQSQQVLSNTISNFSKDYQQKIKGIDDTKPSTILGKFLDLYRNAIGFVNFFGNVKNIKKVEDNLKALRKLFQNSFDIAKVLRQTIIKIVNQLSNLPRANPNAGGLNIDVGVPGGRLKQSAGPSVRNVGRGRGSSLLRMGAIGLGGLGLGATGMFAAKEFQERKLSEAQAVPSTGMLPSNMIDSLSAIIDRFSNAVENLISKSEKKGSTTSGGGGGGAAPSREPPPGSGGPGAMSGTPEQKAMLDAISFAEGTQGSYGTVSGGEVNKDLEQGKLTVKDVIDLGNTFGKPGSKHKWSGATGRYQFMPNTLQDLVNKGVLKPNEPFTPQKQDEAALWLAYEKGVTPELLSKEGLSANVVNKLAPVWASFPTLSGKSYYGQSVKSLSDIQRSYSKSLKSPTVATSPTQQSQVSAAPTQTQATQTRSQDISQPAQQAPQMIQLPPQIMNMGAQQQPQSTGEVIAPPPQQHAGPEVPFLPTSNPDNFFVMYSRMVYNIVDG